MKKSCKNCVHYDNDDCWYKSDSKGDGGCENLEFWTFNPPTNEGIFYIIEKLEKRVKKLESKNNLLKRKSNVIK